MRYLFLIPFLLVGCSSEHERGKNVKDANVAADRPTITRPAKDKPADKDKDKPAEKDKK
jgi:hypothetical protein